MGLRRCQLVRADAPRFTVVGKPIDLDLFLDHVRRTLKAPVGRHAAAARAKVELVLYVEPGSAASARAEQTMARVLRSFDAEAFSYSRCDRALNPAPARRDGVAFTPTLVKRHPAPRFWIVGDLGDGTPVADLLRSCGVGSSREVS